MFILAIALLQEGWFWSAILLLYVVFWKKFEDK